MTAGLWAARDANGMLYLYDREPVWNGRAFRCPGGSARPLFDDLLPAVKPGTCRRVTLTLHDEEG